VEWIVFDYGEVISLRPPAQAGALLARTAGVTPERFWQVYWQGRPAYDLGATDAAGFWGDVCARLGRTADEKLIDTLVAHDLAAWSHHNPETLCLLEELAAADTRLALLSNAPAEVARWIDDQPWAALFRHRFFSTDLRRAKPDPRIFREVCERLGARPGDLVFVDDRQENIDTAQALGIESVLFTDVPRLRSELDRVRAVRAAESGR
jgi:putative hydrolase of the HAD superfamily